MAKAKISSKQENIINNDNTAAKLSRVADKIKTIDELAELVQTAKDNGKTIVHAHGCFDLIHLGHIKHLEAAREHGDMLIVTLTADQYVNKGPNRPVFGEQQRAEMMASIGIVDFVAVNYNPDAIPVLRKVKPSIYIKGQDYKDPEGDVTGKITEERRAVEDGGGKLVFTDEITFSSTELLNRNFNIYEPHTRAYLDSLRNDHGLNNILNELEKIKDYSVLLIGDAIIDEYQYVFPMGKAAKENMIATRFKDAEKFAGGIFATANHLASFCKNVEVITVLGGRDSHEELIRDSLKPNVRLTTLTRKGAPTTRKLRYVDPGYMRKLFEVYFMDDKPLDETLEDDFNNEILERIKKFDVVISNDFGHGLIKKSTIEILEKESKFLAVNAQSNSANMGYNLISKYNRADYICIDLPEAQLATSDRVSDITEIISARLPALVNCPNFIVTHGKHGCVSYHKDGIVHTIPAVARGVVDTVGAGDAFLSITSPLVAAGTPLSVVGLIGNVVGALKVQIVGHQKSVDKVSVIKSLTSLLK